MAILPNFGPKYGHFQPKMAEFFSAVDVRSGGSGKEVKRMPLRSFLRSVTFGGALRPLAPNLPERRSAALFSGAGTQVWPPSCCLKKPTPFMGSDELPLWHFNPTFGSSHSASSAYQKWPTWHSDSNVRLHSSKPHFSPI